MKATEILNNQPVKPEKPVPDFKSAKAKDEYLAKLAIYERELKELPGKRKAYKASVFAKLDNAGADAWLNLVHEFHALRTGKPGAQDTMASDWIADFRKAFAVKFPGKAILPVKSGVQIQGYSIETIEAQEALKLAAKVMEMRRRFPSLFVEGLTIDSIKAAIESEEEIAKEQVIAAHTLRDLSELIAANDRNMGDLQATASAIAAYGADVPVRLARDIEQVTARAESLKAAAAEFSKVAI